MVLTGFPSGEIGVWINGRHHSIMLSTLNCATQLKKRGRIGRFRYMAWVKCPYRVAGKASALRAGKRAPG